MAWTNPLSGVLTSGFNLGRVHPVYGYRQAHRGSDVAPRAGHVWVGSINDGTVIGIKTGRRRGTRTTNTFATPHGTMWFGTGNSVLIRHTGDVYSYYGHLATVNVVPGQSVRAGQAIGRVGTTGVSTGVHLHLEILIGGWNHVNPRHWLSQRGVSLGYGRTSISTGPVIPPTAYPSVQMRATPLAFKITIGIPQWHR